MPLGEFSDWLKAHADRSTDGKGVPMKKPAMFPGEIDHARMAQKWADWRNS